MTSTITAYVEGTDMDVDLSDVVCEGCGVEHRFDLDRIRLEAVCLFCGCVNEGILHGPKPEARRGVRGCMPWF